MEINRYNISCCINNLSCDEKKFKKDDGCKEEICSLAFKNLISQSQAIYEKSNYNDSLEVLKNKSVAMTFLDKTVNLKGELHADSKEVEKYVCGDYTFSSMEALWRFTKLINQKGLSKNEIEYLEQWIAKEQTFLQIGMIFDTWLIVGGGVNKMQLAPPHIQKIDPPTDEVKIFSTAIAKEIKHMKAGDEYKIPSGSLGHITRIKFKKNSDGTFDLFHFNTGLGCLTLNGTMTSACKYPSIPAEKLEDPTFWESFVKVKMQHEMEQLNNLLESLATPVDINFWLKKSLQETGSCAFQSVLAEFKHSFITSFPTLEEGWHSYKVCANLLISQTVESEGSSLECSIKRLLLTKKARHQRYVDWLSIIDKPEIFSDVKDNYIKAIISLDKINDYVCERLIKGLSPFMALTVLNSTLDKCLEHVSYEKLMDIRNTYGNNIGSKQLLWIESTNEVLRDMLKFSGQKEVLENTKELETLLKKYILREDLSISSSIVEDLIKKGLISKEFDFDLIALKHVEKSIKCDKERAIVLLKRMSNKNYEFDFLKISTSLARIAREDSPENAIEIANLINNNSGRELCFQKIFDSLIAIKNFELALELVEKIPDSAKPEALMRIALEKSTKSYVDEAIEKIEKFSDKMKKLLCLMKIALESAKMGEVDKALKVCNKIEPPLPNMLNIAMKSIVVEMTKHDPSKALEIAGRFPNNIMHPNIKKEDSAHSEKLRKS